jgi:hypothetical protein
MLDTKKQLNRESIKAAASSAAVLLITAVHHMYGAIVYNTPWRQHIVMPAILTAITIAAMLYVSSSRAQTIIGKVSFWLAIGGILIASVGFIGFYEGGYNHVVKNVVYFSGASESVMRKLFPSPLYERPNNLFFEATGILTFIAALPAAYYVYPLINIWRQIHRSSLNMKKAEV